MMMIMMLMIMIWLLVWSVILLAVTLNTFDEFCINSFPIRFLSVPHFFLRLLQLALQ